MKKIVYLAPVLLLSSAGKGAMADQTTHISHLDRGFMTNVSELQQDQAVPNKSVVASETNEVKKSESGQDQATQNKSITVNKANEVNKVTATHISSLDSNDMIYNTLNVSSGNKSATYTNFAESKQVAANDDSEKYSVVNDTNNHNYSVNNPEQNKVIIHYVDENGKSISGLKDYTIDLAQQPQGITKGQFNVPDNRYVLPDPNEQYDITNLHKTIHHDAITHVVRHPEVSHVVHHEAQGYYTTEEVPDGTYNTYEETTDGGQAYIDQIEGKWIPSEATPDGSGGYTDGSVTYTPNYTEQQEWVQTSPAYDETVIDRPAYDETVVDKPAYNETKGPTVFSETNTLNIKSIVGNTINVILKHGTKNVNANNSDMELDSYRKVHVINSDNQNNLTNESVKFKVGYTLDLVSSAKIANFNSSQALSDPKNFISKNNLTDPVGFSTINNKLLSISL